MPHYNEQIKYLFITKLQSGFSQQSLSKIFNITPRTIYNWKKEYELRGYFKEKKHSIRKGKIDKDKLHQLISGNPNQTLLELAKIFNVTPQSVHSMLQKLGYRYKKSRLPTRKLMKKNVRIIY